MSNPRLVNRIRAEVYATAINLLEQEMERVDNLPTDTEPQANKARCAAWGIIDTIENDYVIDLLTRKQAKPFYDFVNKKQKLWEKIFAKRRS